MRATTINKLIFVQILSSEQTLIHIELWQRVIKDRQKNVIHSIIVEVL